MRTSYENFQSYFLEFIDFIKNTTFNEENTQKNLLKERYYQNLTYLERMAKGFGELNFFLKWTVKINLFLGVGASVFLVASPLFFVLSAFSIPFIFFLEDQYKVMHNRFCQLVLDLETSEHQLAQMLSANEVLKTQLTTALEQNESIVKKLAETEQEIQKIRERVQQKEESIQRASRIIEDSAAIVRETTEKFIGFETDSKSQTKDFLAYLSEICSEVQKTRVSLETNLNVDEELLETIEFQQKLKHYLEDNYGKILLQPSSLQNLSMYRPALEGQITNDLSEIKILP